MRAWILLGLILVATPSYAERWICYDELALNVTKRVQGDCLALGICSGFNNTGLLPNCFEATAQEFQKAQDFYVKVNISNGVGNRVIDWTQAEIDADLAEQAAAQAAAKAAAISALDDKLDSVQVGDMTLAKVDAKIDNISNLTQAKAFLKLLCRAIIKLQTGQ